MRESGFTPCLRIGFKDLSRLWIRDDIRRRENLISHRKPHMFPDKVATRSDIG
jgi:hypothetical protein